MVYYFTSKVVQPSAFIYVGKDKYESMDRPFSHFLSSFATKLKEIWPALFTCHRWGFDKARTGQGRLVIILISSFSYLWTRQLTAVSYSHRVHFTLSTLNHLPLTTIAQFHVDNLSSAHVYLRLRDGETWDNIPQKLVDDCAQLTKANSIEGPLPITT